MSQDVKVNHKISSFAAPTADDIAYFNGLSDEEKKVLLLEELQDDGAENVTISKDLSYRVFANALKRSNDK